ncbi:DUF1697 domain-containing protein [Microlunatus speluncae]|uniref:DUF1697 domain-containing protein n=1 Tax=Microlunatus speluncae TaxID=2594267 RepID=UPI0012661257|nr:DUF1697 domain-containing protein [Microlunatus speluncae]
MTRYVALLRGVNLGRRKVAMAELREVAEAAGFTEVRTHLNSGNLIIESTGDADSVRTTLEPVIAERFGFEVPVVVRSAKQLRAALAANPFDAANPSQLIITFCAAKPSAAAVSKLRALASDQEELAVHGQEIFIDYRGGLARSKLGASGDPGTIATGRNLRTVQKLVELME